MTKVIGGDGAGLRPTTHVEAFDRIVANCTDECTAEAKSTTADTDGETRVVFEALALRHMGNVPARLFLTGGS